MQLLNPQTWRGKHPDQPTNDMLEAVIGWFERKGLKSIKHDWHQKTWNYDFVDFMKSKQVLATLMTPQGYGEKAAWNTLRNVEFAEIAGFYGITYWYTFQVSMLGLGPIFNGDNEAVKHRAAQLLKDGAVFAFGLSEREHGADIYSSDMRLVPQADGGYVARGSKYYIGNGNEAALVSTFGKNSETGDYVFFVVDSKHDELRVREKHLQRAELRRRIPPARLPDQRSRHPEQRPRRPGTTCSTPSTTASSTWASARSACARMLFTSP